MTVEVDAEMMEGKKCPPTGTYKNIRAWVKGNYGLTVAMANIANMKDELELVKQFSYAEVDMAAKRCQGYPDEKEKAIIRTSSTSV